MNTQGVNYYNKLIDTLLANGIKPAVTLYHFDLPQALQDVSGWHNPKISDIFNEYAQFCFKEFGDRVEIWLTINEPHEEALDAYGLGSFAPGLKNMATGPYLGMCDQWIINSVFNENIHTHPTEGSLLWNPIPTLLLIISVLVHTFLPFFLAFESSSPLKFPVILLRVGIDVFWNHTNMNFCIVRFHS